MCQINTEENSNMILSLVLFSLVFYSNIINFPVHKNKKKKTTSKGKNIELN